MPDKPTGNGTFSPPEVARLSVPGVASQCLRAAWKAAPRSGRPCPSSSPARRTGHGGLVLFLARYFRKRPHFCLGFHGMKGDFTSRMTRKIPHISAIYKAVGNVLRSRIGAGEGNRTLVVSLGSFCSAIELHPQRCRKDQLGHPPAALG